MGEQDYTFLDFNVAASSMMFAKKTNYTPNIISIHPFSATPKDEVISQPEKDSCRIYFISYPEVASFRCTPTLHCAVAVDIGDETYVESTDSELPWLKIINEHLGAERVPIVLEQSLLRERMRGAPFGVTDYEVSESGDRLLLTAAGGIFFCQVPRSLGAGCLPAASGGDFPTRIDESAVSCPLEPVEAPVPAPLQPIICPCSDDLAACVTNGELIVGHLPTNTWTQLTHEVVGKNVVHVGMPAFVIQEEFDRYIGFWWCPAFVASGDASDSHWRPPEADSGRIKRFRILYELVDESKVQEVYINDGERLEIHRYPKAGRDNAISDLRICEFWISEEEGKLTSVRHLRLSLPLMEYLPEFEYLVRADWTPDGRYVWVQLITRLQEQLELILIPVDNFHPVEMIQDQPSDLSAAPTTTSDQEPMSVNETKPMVYMSPCIRLVKEFNDIYWIEVNNKLNFLEHATSDATASSQGHENSQGSSFIWGSHRSGFSHLYLMHRSWPKPGGDIGVAVTNRPALVIDADEVLTCQLTSGRWEVLDNGIWVDETRELVIFHGNREHPLLEHVYAVAYSPDLRGQISQLTPIACRPVGSGHPAEPAGDLNGDPSSTAPPPIIDFDPAFPRPSDTTSWWDRDGSSPSLWGEYPFSFHLESFNASSGWAVVTSSSLNRLPGCQVVRLAKLQSRYVLCHVAWLRRHIVHDSQIVPKLQLCAPPQVFRFDLSQCTSNGEVVPSADAACDPSLQPPTFIMWPIDEPPMVPLQTPTYIYGQLFLPADPPASQAGYPLIHLVYGGPGVQLVHGRYPKSILWHALLYCQFGYAVFVCDCRGSTNRGIEFAGHVKNRLGQVELEDHIAFLRNVASFTGLIDMSRVAITGSSYGGYLSLMGLMYYSEVYKAAIAVSPVSNWELYDTAYTERYLASPQSNVTAYYRSSVFGRMYRMPADKNRLLISHGGQDDNVHFQQTAELLAEFSRSGLPYKLLFFHNCRHAIQQQGYLEAALLLHLEEVLKPVRTRVDPYSAAT